MAGRLDAQAIARFGAEGCLARQPPSKTIPIIHEFFCERTAFIKARAALENPRNPLKFLFVCKMNVQTLTAWTIQLEKIDQKIKSDSEKECSLYPDWSRE